MTGRFLSLAERAIGPCDDGVRKQHSRGNARVTRESPRIGTRAMVQAGVICFAGDEGASLLVKRQIRRQAEGRLRVRGALS